MNFTRLKYSNIILKYSIEYIYTVDELYFTIYDTLLYTTTQYHIQHYTLLYHNISYLFQFGYISLSITLSFLLFIPYKHTFFILYFLVYYISLFSYIYTMFL